MSLLCSQLLSAASRWLNNMCDKHLYFSLDQSSDWHWHPNGHSTSHANDIKKKQTNKLTNTTHSTTYLLKTYKYTTYNNANEQIAASVSWFNHSVFSAWMSWRIWPLALQLDIQMGTTQSLSAGGREIYALICFAFLWAALSNTGNFGELFFLLFALKLPNRAVMLNEKILSTELMCVTSNTCYLTAFWAAQKKNILRGRHTNLNRQKTFFTLSNMCCSLSSLQGITIYKMKLYILQPLPIQHSK